MRLLEKEIGQPKELVFLDLEGTQLSHETIAIGACAYFCDEHLMPVKNKKVKIYKAYVKTDSKIGGLVVRLTGITPETLNAKGIPFSKAIAGLVEFSKCQSGKRKYITFGNQDLNMLRVSSLKDETGVANQFYDHIKRNWFDLQEFISHFVFDAKHLTYSQAKLLEIFEAEDLKHAHDPLYDAENLMNLFIQLNKRPDILSKWFLKNMSNCDQTGAILEPFIKEQLLKKPTINSKDFMNYLLEYFK